mgnify:CR=1 FL=1
MDDNLLRIASLTARLNRAEKSLALKREQHHEVCVELVVYEQELTRIKQENLDLRVKIYGDYRSVDA